MKFPAPKIWPANWNIIKALNEKIRKLMDESHHNPYKLDLCNIIYSQFLLTAFAVIFSDIIAFTGDELLDGRD